MEACAPKEQASRSPEGTTVQPLTGGACSEPRAVALPGSQPRGGAVTILGQRAQISDLGCAEAPATWGRNSVHPSRFLPITNSTPQPEPALLWTPGVPRAQASGQLAAPMAPGRVGSPGPELLSWESLSLPLLTT